MKAKKSLGQHWLRSTTVRDQIIRAADLQITDTVLEIGPGTGVLTEALLRGAGRVIAIEKDEKLIAVVQKKFAHDIETKKLILIEGDILDFKPDKHSLIPHSYKIVANIPYYITGQFFRKFLQTESQPSSLVVLVQKEVAERIVARDQKESILSISVKAYGEPQLVATVPPGAFTPPPEVASALLSVKQISRDRFKNLPENKFFALVKQGFAHKRKKLMSNLGLSNEQLQTCGLDAQIRAEALQLDDWLCLTEQLSSQ